MKTGRHITEQEINQFMDFDGLLKRKEQALSRHRKLTRVRNVSIGILVLLIPVVLIVTRQPETMNGASSDLKGMSPPSATVPLDSAEVKASISDSGMPAPNHTVDSMLGRSAEAAERNKPLDKKQANTAPVMKEERINAPTGYVQPEPVDGYAALYDYFDKTLKYPAVTAKDSVEGVVTVAFVIDVNGNVKTISVQNSLGDAFDQEVRRLVDHMPSWRPATYDGRPVEGKVSLPITFSLNRSTNP